MKFARFVFWGAGVWGIAILTPLYFLFDTIGSRQSSPITYPLTEVLKAKGLLVEDAELEPAL